MTRFTEILVGSWLVIASAALAQDVQPIASAARQAESLAPAPPTAPESLADLAPVVESLGRAASMGASTRAQHEIESALEEWADQLERVAPTAIFGIPTHAERDHAHLAALNVLRLASGAEDLIPRVLDAMVDDEGNRARSGDLLHERRVVLPLRCARALLVLSALAPEDERGARIGLARLALGLARPVEGVSAWARSERALLIAHALHLMGEGEEAGRRYGVIHRNLPDLPAFFRDRLLIESRLGEALVARVSAFESPPLESRRWSDVDLRVLRADASMRIALDLASASSVRNERNALLARGIREFELARLATDGLDAGASVRELLYEKLGVVMGDDWDIESLPVMAQLVQFVRPSLPITPDSLLHRAQSLRDRLASGGAIPEPIVRDIEWALAGGMNPFPTFNNQGVMTSVRGPVRGATWETLLAFATAHSSDDRAEEAYLRAHALVQRLLTQWGVSRPGMRDRHLAVLPFYFAVDETEIGIEGRDEIRLEVGRLVRGHGGDAETIERVLDCVGSVSSEGLQIERRTVEAELFSKLIEGGDESARGGFIETMRERIVRDEIRARIEGGSQESDREQAMLFELARIEGEGERPERAIAALDQLIEARALSSQAWNDRVRAMHQKLGILIEVNEIERAVVLIETLRSDERTRSGHAARCLWLTQEAWKRIEPRTHRFLDGSPGALDAEATRVIDRACELAGDAKSKELAQRQAWIELLRGDHQGAIALFERSGQGSLRGLGEAQLLVGEDAAAFASFKVLAETASSDSRDYFHAWVRMLEILERQNADGTRTARIRRELARVQMLPELGAYPSCQRRLAALRERIPMAVGSSISRSRLA